MRKFRVSHMRKIPNKKCCYVKKGKLFCMYMYLHVLHGKMSLKMATKKIFRRVNLILPKKKYKTYDSQSHHANKT